MPAEWLKGYRKDTFASDLIAGLIVTMLLIPQSLAYALLAGLPPEMGLYASILPLVAYALLGSSRTLSVGPVAVVSLMTAMAVGKVAEAGTLEYATAAIALAGLCGLILLLMALLRFGFLANFLSHPVVSGFITASAVVIVLTQVKHLLGVTASGDNILEVLASLMGQLDSVHMPTLVVASSAIAFLVWAKRYLAPLLVRLGLPEHTAVIISKAAPALMVITVIVTSYLLDFAQRGIALVGEIPRGLPGLSVPAFDQALWLELAGSAALIAVIGFVESVSVGKTLAAKRRQRINPNRELLALGGANIAASVSGGFPVTGGFSRSVVNFDAGAQTPAASIFAAAGIAASAVFLTPLLFFLPKAALAATIIVAVSQLIDVKLMQRAWRYAFSDFIAVLLTVVATLLLGVELGVLIGIVVSVSLHLYKTTRPHIAVVGAIAGTEHYRNVSRHNVITHPNLVSLRIDESLYFANASYLEDYIYALIADNPGIEHVILQCTAINEIDMSALEALEAIDHRLREQGISLNLSEVKGPVMDALMSVDFVEQLSGRVFLSHHQAVKALKTEEIEPYII